MLAFSDCTVSIEPGVPPLVVVAGEVNYESAPRIREVLSALQHEGQSRLILDCSRVDFIDSSGIGAIVHCAQSLKQCGGGLVLKAATHQLLHALRVSGFIDQLDLLTQFSEVARMHWPQGMKGVWQQSELRLPLKADRDGLMRKRVTEMAAAMPFTRDQIDDIRLAVGEAVSNAVRHGCSGSELDMLTMRCAADGEKLVVSIHNPGRPFDPGAIPVPDPRVLREGGMGIFFMRSSMDLVEYEFDPTGTTVIMTKYVKADNLESHDN
jgi:serine/threonine-protein kinase RsbW